MTNTNNNNAIKGASDLYSLMLEIKNGTPSSGRGCTHITKKQAKELGIKWSFVENSCKLLNLELTRHGNYGFSIARF